MASIDKRDDGTYRARWREYPGGPQRTKAFRRKVDAERHLVEVQHQLARGEYLEPKAGHTPFDAYVAAFVARGMWRDSTTASVRAALAHAVRAFGSRPLVSIKRADLQLFLKGLEMSDGYRRIVRQHLGSVFNAAVADQMLARSPMAGLRLDTATTAPVVPPTVEAVQRLHEAAPGWFRVAVVLGAGLGLRQAEATGLTVDRVDFLRRTARDDSAGARWGAAQPEPVR